MAETRSKISSGISEGRGDDCEWKPVASNEKPRLSVLLYHHVGNPKPETLRLGLTVTPAKFRRQVRWLRWRGYTAITPSQWLAWCTTGELLPPKPIMFTFDDAYEDICTHALPILERFGFSGTVFVISGQVGGLTSWDGLPMMTIGQIRYWASHGFEIGAHTRTHPDLTVVPEGALSNEVQGSKEDLTRAGLIPRSFAYPFGSFDDRSRAAMNGVFSLAFTCEEGLNDSTTDLLLLRRTMVQPGDTLLDIELRAAFGKSAFNWLRSRLRLRSRFLKILGSLRLHA